MVDVMELIPSRDMRSALHEIGREFSDMEKATIVANVGLSPRRRRELLQRLMDETDDEVLRGQLRYALRCEERLLAWFRDAADGCVYGVQVQDEDCPDDGSVDAYFSGFRAAYGFGRSADAAFRVRKWIVRDAAPRGEWWSHDGDCGSLSFDANGEMVQLLLWRDGDAADADEGQFAPDIVVGEGWPHYLYFEDRWLDLPNVYEQGDIVRVLGGKASYIDPAYDWAVVAADNAEWSAASERARRRLQGAEGGGCKPTGLVPDYSDMQVLVEFPCKDGTFAHDHINPMFLERAEDAADGIEGELREMATWAATGQCGLEHVSCVLKKHGLARMGTV